MCQTCFQQWMELTKLNSKNNDFNVLVSQSEGPAPKLMPLVYQCQAGVSFPKQNMVTSSVIANRFQWESQP